MVKIDPELYPYVGVMLVAFFVLVSYNAHVADIERVGRNYTLVENVVQKALHGDAVGIQSTGMKESENQKAITNDKEGSKVGSSHEGYISDSRIPPLLSHTGYASFFHSTASEDHESLRTIIKQQEEVMKNMKQMKQELDDVLEEVEMVRASINEGITSLTKHLSGSSSPSETELPNTAQIKMAPRKAHIRKVQRPHRAKKHFKGHATTNKTNNRHTSEGTSLNATKDGRKHGKVFDAIDGIHFIFTSNGNPYSNFQTRFLYHSYLEVVKQKGSILKNITRILHRSVEDELMNEIPTFRVDPKYPHCEQWCEFPVNDRPLAIQAFLRTPESRVFKYLLIGEPDYLFMKTLTLHHLPPQGEANAFPYGYIIPFFSEETRAITRRIMNRPDMTTEEMKQIPGTGPCPLLLETVLMDKVVPQWVNYTFTIDADAQAKKTFGWVREMYAYSFAAYESNLKHNIPTVQQGNMLLSQPPADHSPGKSAILHYTWGSQLRYGVGEGGQSFNKSAPMIWEFDKRLFTGGIPHKKLPFPPKQLPTDGRLLFLQDGRVVTQDLLDFLNLMMKIINGSFDRFDPMPCGKGSNYGISCPTDHHGPCRWPYKCDENDRTKFVEHSPSV